MAAETNLYEESGRAVKATTLWRWCKKNGVTAETAMDYASWQWEMIAAEAHINPPSRNTIKQALQYLLGSQRKQETT